MSDFKLLNRVKKMKLRKALIGAQVQRLMAELPTYTPEELRRLQMPYHEALYCEMTENGYYESVYYIKRLIEYQEERRVENGLETSMANKPRLLHSKHILDKLMVGFSKAEQFSQQNEFYNEANQYLHMAHEFCFLIEDWEWLGEEILIKCLKSCKKLVGSEREIEGICRFMYGKFKLNTTENIDTAIEHFELCRIICEGQHWRVRHFFPEYTFPLSEEVCLTLYKAYYEKAKQLLRVYPKNAGKYAMLAKKRAVQACFAEGMTESLLLKGITDMVDNNLKTAIQSILAGLNIQLKHSKDPDPRLKLAVDCLRKGKTIAALEILIVLKDSLNIKGLPYFIAQAYRYLGEIKLGKGEAAEATPLLNMSLNIFLELDMFKEIEQLRTLAAISAGQELMSKYTDLIIKCGRKGREGTEYLSRLVRWKGTREPFWNEDEISLPSGDSKSFELGSNISEVVPSIVTETISLEYSDEENVSTETDLISRVSFFLEMTKKIEQTDVKSEETVAKEEEVEVIKEQIEEESLHVPISITNSWMEVDPYYGNFTGDFVILKDIIIEGEGEEPPSQNVWKYDETDMTKEEIHELATQEEEVSETNIVEIMAFDQKGETMSESTLVTGADDEISNVMGDHGKTDEVVTIDEVSDDQL